MAVKGLMMHQKLIGTGMVVSRAILICRILGDAFRFSARFSELLYLCSEDWCNMLQFCRTQSVRNHINLPWKSVHA
jgi:hypothetical protein